MFSRDSLWTVRAWSFTKFCHTLLISPPLPPTQHAHRACHWKTSSISPEDVETQAFVSAVKCGAPAYLSFHVGILSGFVFRWQQGEWLFFFLLWIRPFKLPTLQSNSVSRPFIGTTEYFQIKDIQYCQLIMCPVCVLLNISTAAFLLSPVALAHVICKCFYSAFISIKSTPQIKPQLCCNQRSPIWLWWARKSKPPKRGESSLGKDDQMALLAGRVRGQTVRGLVIGLIYPQSPECHLHQTATIIAASLLHCLRGRKCVHGVCLCMYR